MSNPWVATAAPAGTDQSGRVIAILWVGTTTAGDQVLLRNGDGRVLWEAITDTTSTYLGISMGSYGINVSGVSVARLDSGRILVYYAEA